MELEKHSKLFGRIGGILVTFVFASFLHQAYLNLVVSKGSILVPIAATISCSVWVLYGLATNQKCIFVPNMLGVICSMIYIITWLM